MTEVMAAEIEKLIERLEKATGPDSLINRDIFEAVHPNEQFSAAGPSYTRSIDAAITLVPNGLVVSLGNDRGFCWAWVGKQDEDTTAYTGENIAIALCIAALRALSHKGASND